MNAACPLCGYRFTTPRARCANPKACARRQARPAAAAAPTPVYRPDTYLVGGLQWTPGPRESTRCTQTVLMQFGIFDLVPKTGTGMLEAFMARGFDYFICDLPSYGPRVTVRRFILDHPKGRYYIFTRGHAMAVIDGLLVDSAEEGPNRRIILGAYEIKESA